MKALIITSILIIILVYIMCASTMTAHRLTLVSLIRCKQKIHNENLEIGHSFLNFWYVYNEIYENNDYEPFIVRKGGTILDIGGNMGLFTLWADERIEDGTIYVFEPIPELMNKIKKNTKNCKNTIIYVNKALGSKKNIETIKYYPHANALSTLNPANKKTIMTDTLSTKIASKFYLKNELDVKIEVVPLENLNIDLPQEIDFVKIDVEGYELEVLRGFGSLLSRVQLMLVEVESFNKALLFDIIQLIDKTHIVHLRSDARENWNMIIGIRKLV